MTNTENARKARFGSRKGQSMVEFSLVFVLFLVMMGGLFEFSRVLWAYTTLAHATRQGARYAMVHGQYNPVTTDQIIAKVKSEAIGLDPDLVTVTPAFTPNNNIGSFVNVQATYPLPLVIGPLLFASRNSFTLRADSQMVVLN